MPSMKQVQMGKQPMYVEVFEQLLRCFMTASLTVWGVSTTLHVAVSETEQIYS